MLAGAVAISNITANPFFSVAPVYTNVVIPPSGVDLVNAPVWRIVNDATYGINAIRANLYPSSGFTHVGDILRVPMLTEKSPFINRSDISQVDYDLSDEVYERLPQQILGLLRPAGVPRFVVYAYGQTLKPAPDGTVLSGGQSFGLVTNYQVVAESATRAVMSVQQVVTNTATGPVTNYTTKVESFNVLPPE